MSIFTLPKGGASGPAFIACHWDDVAVRKGAPHFPFCSTRCKEAFEKDKTERAQTRCHDALSTAPRDPCYPAEVVGRLPHETDWESTTGLAYSSMDAYAHCDELDQRAEQLAQRTVGAFAFTPGRGKATGG